MKKLILIFVCLQFITYAQDDSASKLMEQINNNANVVNKLLNQKLPSFTLTTLDGKILTDKDLEGKVSVINFWFIACEKCRDEMPFFNELKGEFKSQDINFIAITFDDSAKVAHFLKRNDFNFTHLIYARDYTTKIRIQNYPRTFLVDKRLQIKKILKFMKEDYTKEEKTKWKDDFRQDIKELIKAI
jgi:peroxiredoxin